MLLQLRKRLYRRMGAMHDIVLTWHVREIDWSIWNRERHIMQLTSKLIQLQSNEETSITNQTDSCCHTPDITVDTKWRHHNITMFSNTHHCTSTVRVYSQRPTTYIIRRPVHAFGYLLTQATAVTWLSDLHSKRVDSGEAESYTQCEQVATGNDPVYRSTWGFEQKCNIHSSVQQRHREKFIHHDR